MRHPESAVAPLEVTVPAGPAGPGPARYRLAADLVAVHRPDRPVPAVRPVREAARPPSGDAVLGPVYRRVPGGDLVVPTGRVLVRYSEGDRAERHRGELERTGYRMDRILGYAPHAAWVRAADGGIAAALRRTAAIAALPGVRHVEPELLGERQARG
ncbi:hypothetical protein [Marinactinospora rubrisoli]|uniref:Uncharacterized protein n=1 Tax=Marinactinospora rubrisoli TaxID=2715399 RepID=A0ABW2KHB8_9ACTN